jgi:hypothetical protein
MQDPDYGDDSFNNIVKEREKYRLVITSVAPWEETKLKKRQRKTYPFLNLSLFLNPG